jgi:hypothetical protein
MVDMASNIAERNVFVEQRTIRQLSKISLFGRMGFEKS